ncbi:hypothetical protein Mgra_00009734 [Meloidogyne graminicola]|uniref:Uncharacterized protein n=1 Tax=Meloidogyne graminicola TaxID=189291 RepID=A0A8S9Z9A4_9BILA|nr:hypothetical protein Mgra_00009734 [Meloidogyne graminicola]KAF7626098.1 hypothetical protein Mgra_00009734 [Meloidogyne graminicola]
MHQIKISIIFVILFVASNIILVKSMTSEDFCKHPNDGYQTLNNCNFRQNALDCCNSRTACTGSLCEDYFCNCIKEKLTSTFSNCAVDVINFFKCGRFGK